jgi:hypothetical protein
MEKTEDASSGTTLPRHSRDEENKGSKLSSSPDATEVPRVNSPETASANVSGEKEYEYLTGFKLAALMFSLTLVAFLMLLDTSIVSTVSLYTPTSGIAFS